MKKIMFNDRFGLTQSVLEGRKTMTRRIASIQPPYKNNEIAFPVFAGDGEGSPLWLAYCWVNKDNPDEHTKWVKPQYNKEGEIIAIAQSYKALGYDPESLELQQKEIALAAPKVQYVDTVLKSVNTYATNLIAKEMGMSAETLNKRLKEKGIQYRQSGVWVLTSRYQDKGYTKTRTHTYTRSDGSQSTAMLTVWTEQGREFLHSLFKA